METGAGLPDPQKPAITPCSILKFAILSIADILFLTNLQKRENRLNQSSLDNIKMQVA